MKLATGVATLVLSIAPWLAASAGANEFAGEWLGGFRGRNDWVFLQVRFGGEGELMAGRADLPAHGEEAILLSRVAAEGSRLSFEMPNSSEPLAFAGELRPDGRIVGVVRQGQASGEFELLRTSRQPADALAALAGTFVVDPEGATILVYFAEGALNYVDYTSGRTGRLFALDATRFVSGPSVLTGFPVHLTVAFERDAAGRATGLTWHRSGNQPRTARRRDVYRVEDVSFHGPAGVRLAGSLLVPIHRGPHPALVIIPGSGRTSHEALLPFADSFARHGIAVLVADKRGVGGSTGDYGRTGIEDMAEDALAGVAWLRTHPSIDPRQIGLVGASLGGWVAPLAASRSPDVRFVVVEAAPAVTPAEHELLRVKNQMLADRWPPATISRALAFMERKFSVARTGKGWDHLARSIEPARREGWLSYVNAPTSLEDLRWNWSHILSYDPLPALRAVRVPVLAIYGSLDRIVDARTNQTRLEQALRSSGNGDVTVRVLPGANHNFLAARNGGRLEAQELAAFVDGYFDARLQWVLDRVEERRPASGDLAAASPIPAGPSLTVRADAASSSGETALAPEDQPEALTGFRPSSPSMRQ